MSVTLVRVPLTLAAALAFHVSMSPPSTSDTDSTPGNRRAVCVTASVRFITAALTKGLFWVSALADTLVVLAPHAPTSHPALSSISIPSAGTLLSWMRQLGLSLSLPTSLSLQLPFLPPLPLVTVAGTTLVLTGTYLRYAAYHALGQFYACPNRGSGTCAPRGARQGHSHALITTGPHAFVRHPGYAGLALCTTGLVVLQLDALRASGGGFLGAGQGVGASVGMRVVALVCATLATVGALRRIREEEWSLRARFKGEWEAWAEKVPYRLVPGVY